MPNCRVDGMDVLAVRQAALEVIEQVRHGAGPYFMEVITYRYRGHSMGDPERYRSPDEVRQWQENDPIGIYRHYLTGQGIANEEELNQIDAQVGLEVQEAVQFAESSPEPPPQALFEHVYVEA